MSATTSPFSQLPRELRDMIWSTAAAVQFQHIADQLPTTSITSNAALERQRQVFIGYDNLPRDIERQPLRLYIYDTPDREKVRLGVNEFQTLLVNHLSVAAVCSEAHSQTVDFCHSQVDFFDLFYSVDPSGEPSGARYEISEPLFLPSTVMVSTIGREGKQPPFGFTSADHLVNTVHRVFGSRVERIILNPWYHSIFDFEDIYWPHTTQTKEAGSTIYSYQRDRTLDELAPDESIFMTPDRKWHAREEFVQKHENDVEVTARNLLKFYEILDVSAQKLPRLQHIELQLRTDVWDEVEVTRIKSAKDKDGNLWVKWSDVKIGTEHLFVEPESPTYDEPESPVLDDDE